MRRHMLHPQHPRLDAATQIVLNYHRSYNTCNETRCTRKHFRLGAPATPVAANYCRSCDTCNDTCCPRSTTGSAHQPHQSFSTIIVHEHSSMIYICNDARCTRKHPSPGSTSHINSLQLLSFIQYVQRRMLHPQLHRLGAPQPQPHQ